MDFDFGPGFFAGLLFSLFGMAYFAYGKKQGNFMVMGAGAGLMVYPYFVSDLLATVALGAALLVFPFIASRFL